MGCERDGIEEDTNISRYVTEQDTKTSIDTMKQQRSGSIRVRFYLDSMFSQKCDATCCLFHSHGLKLLSFEA